MKQKVGSKGRIKQRQRREIEIDRDREREIKIDIKIEKERGKKIDGEMIKKQVERERERR